MQLQILSEGLSSLSYVLLAISPAIFIFSVTLLGTAIEQSKNEEKAARENAKNENQKEIDIVDEALKKARKNGDTTELTTKLEDLKKKQIETEKEIIIIRKKYERINLTNTVVYPCIAFIFIILINLLTSIYENVYFTIIIFVLQIILMAFGLFKLYKSLELVQIINANKKESEQSLRLIENIKTALIEYNQSIKEEAVVEFVDKSFPLNVTTLMDLDIKFKVKLIKGSSLKNTFVWFFVADGFELIIPQEASSWRQPPNHEMPNIRTVQVSLGTVNIGPFVPGHIKIKTPSVPGKYILRCAIRADGYFGGSKDLIIIVG